MSNQKNNKPYQQNNTSKEVTVETAVDETTLTEESPVEAEAVAEIVEPAESKEEMIETEPAVEVVEEVKSVPVVETPKPEIKPAIVNAPKSTINTNNVVIGDASFKIGDVVSIKKGSTDYSGKLIPDRLSVVSFRVEKIIGARIIVAFDNIPSHKFAVSADKLIRL